MIKILYVNATAELGGADNDLLETVRALDKTKFQPTVLLPQAGPHDEAYRELGVPVLYGKLGIIKRSQGRGRQVREVLGLPWVVLRLWWLMRRGSYDLVFNNSLLLLFTGLAARLAGKKVIWHSGEMYTRPRWLKLLLYGLTGLLAHRVIVSSEALRQLFPAWCRGRVVTLHNGIDLSRFDPAQTGATVREELGIPVEALVVGFVGRFIPWKGAKEFMQAAEIAAQKPGLTGAHFVAVGTVLAGYPAYYQEIQALAAASPIAGRLHIVPNRRDIPALLAAFDLFVHASIRPEPFGIVIIEALAMGKPVIATNGGGVPEIINRPTLGRLVEPGKVEAMAEAIVELGTNESERRAMSQTARRVARQRFDIGPVTRRHEAIYSEVKPVGSEPTRQAGEPVELSVVIVNYNGQGQIIGGLEALRAGLEGVAAQVFVVDNASTDGSLSLIKTWLASLPDEEATRYELIENRRNLGYSRANNQAIRQSESEFVLLLNPDAEVEPDTIPKALAFMRQSGRERVGICGPRILLPDGRLDRPCRRSFKTPSIYLYKFLGLSRLFPRNKRFGRYYLSYLDERETTEVDAVIGAFLLIRRAVIEEIGLLDERYFIYCEDEDWCFQAKRRGWRVMYLAEAVVHHQKGASTGQRKLRMVWEWHKAVFKFHRKNLAPDYPLPVNLFVYGGIGAQLGLTLGINLARRVKFHRRKR